MEYHAAAVPAFVSAISNPPGSTRMRVWPGRPSLLGTTCDGINFAIFSENATKVELCLIDWVDAQAEKHRVVLPERLGTRRRDLRWKCILDTSAPNSEPASFEHMSICPLQPHSFVVLQAELFEEREQVWQNRSKATDNQTSSN